MAFIDVVLPAVAPAMIGSLLGGGSSGGGAAAAADPFASQRPQYQQMLQQLMTNPSSFQQSAQSQATTQTGMSAIDASMAAKGLGNSGAEHSALTQFATQTAGQDYQSQMANLMQMSGAGAGSTGTAGNILAGQQQQSQQAIGTVAGKLAGGLTSGGSTGTGVVGGAMNTMDNFANPMNIDTTGISTNNAGYSAAGGY